MILLYDYTKSGQKEEKSKGEKKGRGGKELSPPGFEPRTLCPTVRGPINSPVELGLDPEKIGMEEIFAPFNSVY